jgi:hypothetical protein
MAYVFCLTSTTLKNLCLLQSLITIIIDRWYGMVPYGTIPYNSPPQVLRSAELQSFFSDSTSWWLEGGTRDAVNTGTWTVAWSCDFAIIKRTRMFWTRMRWMRIFWTRMSWTRMFFDSQTRVSGKRVSRSLISWMRMDRMQMERIQWTKIFKHWLNCLLFINCDIFWNAPCQKFNRNQKC